MQALSGTAGYLAATYVIPGQTTGKGKVEWGLPHRGRISPEEAAYVREHLDQVQQLRAARGMPLLDPADRRTKERYGL